MNRIAVVYWSKTGNTKAMAKTLEEGARKAGASVAELPADQFSAENVG